jgi:hypothetical protein
VARELREQSLLRCLDLRAQCSPQRPSF